MCQRMAVHKDICNIALFCYVIVCTWYVYVCVCASNKNKFYEIVMCDHIGGDAMEPCAKVFAVHVLSVIALNNHTSAFSYANARNRWQNAA